MKIALLKPQALRVALLLGLAALASGQGRAQSAGVAAGEGAAAQRSVSEWLMRMHEASRRRTYVGTFVVSAPGGNLSSARIWHACDGTQQMERVESLTGAPKSTFRRNDHVVTFMPDSKVVRTERRESLGLFPGLLKSDETSIPEFYSAQKIGRDRVAGFDTEIVRLAPKDKLRFGYRIWSEKKSGLVVKLQTLDTEGQVIEQAAFSELQLDAPVKMDKLSQMMANTHGYKVERADPLKTSAQTEGWTLKAEVPGFKPVGCYKRPVTVPGPAGADGTVQWIFSDGLASVSLFIEAYDEQRHPQEALFAMGATRTLTHRLGERNRDGAWWLTAVGEVPPQTLKAFAQNLERRK